MYIGQWCLSPLQSRHLGTAHISCPIVFSWISSTFWNFSFSKVILVLGKARSCRMPNLGCRGAELLRWFDVSQANCTRCDAWEGALFWWSCQSTTAHFWILQIVSMEECSSLTKFDADLLLYPLSHFECDGHTVHILTQECLLSPLSSTVKL